MANGLTGSDLIPLLSGTGPLATADGTRRVAVQDVAAGGTDLVPLIDGSGPLAQASITETVSLTAIAAGGARQVPLLDGSGPLAAPSLIRRATLQQIADFGGGSYHADAVHLGGSTFLSTSNFMAADSPLLSLSFWLKFAARDDNPYAPLVTGDPDVTYDPSFALEADEVDISSVYYTVQSDDLSSALGVTSNEIPSSVSPIVSGTWMNILISLDSDHGVGAKIGQMFVNDVSIGPGLVAPNLGDAFTMVFNGLEFAIFSDYANGLLGDVADFWYAPGQFVDFSAEDNRRKFIDSDGKPVDLGSDGSMPTGIAPAIFFSGDISTFPINRGTGGTFTLTGSLTDALTSPSD